MTAHADNKIKREGAIFLQEALAQNIPSKANETYSTNIIHQGNMFKMIKARKAVLPEEDGIAFQHSKITKEHTNTKKIAKPHSQREVSNGWSLNDSSSVIAQHLNPAVKTVPSPNRFGSRCVDVSKHYTTQVTNIIRMLVAMFSEEGSEENIKRIMTVVDEAFKITDELFTAQDAENWGDGFVIPPEAVRSDENLFKASMRDIEVMINRRKRRMKDIRLSEERMIKSCSKDNPEINLLMLLPN